MWSVLRARGRAVREGVRSAPDRVRTSVRLAQQTGLLWSLTRPGITELLRVLASGSQNPYQIYRVHAKNTPSKAALIWRGRTMSFAELDERMDRLSGGLARRGIGRKTSLLLMMRNRPELVEAGAAAARAGAWTVAISWRSTPQELVYLAKHSGARGIVVEADFLPTLLAVKDELPRALRENVIVVGEGEARLPTVAYESLIEDPAPPPEAIATDNEAAVVIYTSGTTGKPKGAVRKFPKDAMHSAFRLLNETPLRVDDVHLVACPLYHATAFGFMSLAHLLGQTVVLMDEFKPDTFLTLVDRHGVSTSAVVPTMLQRVMDLPPQTRTASRTRTLRAIFSCGAPLSAPLAMDFMNAYGDVLYNFYGSTETGLVTLAKPADLRAAPGTIGNALPDNEIRLVGEDGQDVAEGEVGELYAKNKLLVDGYHDDPAATKDSMLGGFFSVGDLARRDASGHYFIEGRKRDMIISGGVNVYPAEVESVLEEHPDVAEVAVVGMADREWGERVRAVVVLKRGVAEDEGSLKAFARERLAGPKVPREFVFLDALPRNPTGKVLKRQLREAS